MDSRLVSTSGRITACTDTERFAGSSAWPQENCVS
jgi:hypothetical protein